MFNTALLKSWKTWLAVLGAILGILLSQHVIVDGSTLANLTGWVLTVLGIGGTGHQVSATSSASA